MYKENQKDLDELVAKICNHAKTFKISCGECNLRLHCNNEIKCNVLALQELVDRK